MPSDTVHGPGQRPLRILHDDIDITTNRSGHLPDQLIGHGGYDEPARRHPEADQHETQCESDRSGREGQAAAQHDRRTVPCGDTAAASPRCPDLRCPWCVFTEPMILAPRILRPWRLLPET